MSYTITHNVRKTTKANKKSIIEIIAEARYYEPTDQIDVYIKSGRNCCGGMLERIFSIDCPTHLQKAEPEQLLEYAQDNIPAELHIDIT